MSTESGVGQTSATNGRAVTYTAYNKPRTISSPVGNSTFYYGGERELVVQIESNGSTSATRTYVGDLYEKIVTGGTTEERFYIQSPFGLVAIRSTRTGQPTPTVQYSHRDHLGSTDVLSGATGVVVQRMSNDAWGKRRNATTWADSALYAFAFEGGVGQSVTPQFTGHKGLGHLELVHMQGRVYDPVLGRFLTADPYVQNPTSTQAFNRYSYVWNNPLSYTDPTGYNVFSRIGGWFSRAWAKFMGAMRRFAKKQGFTLVLGATVPYDLGYLIGGALDSSLTGANVGEVLVAAAMAFALKGNGTSYWSSGSEDYTNVLGGGWAGRRTPKGLERPPSESDIIVNLDPVFDSPDMSRYLDWSGVFGWLDANTRARELGAEKWNSESQGSPRWASKRQDFGDLSDSVQELGLLEGIQEFREQNSSYFRMECGPNNEGRCYDAIAPPPVAVPGSVLAGPGSRVVEAIDRTELGHKLIGMSSKAVWQQNRYFRIGISRAGGRKVFRISIGGDPNTKHYINLDLGKL